MTETIVCWKAQPHLGVGYATDVFGANFGFLESLLHKTDHMFLQASSRLSVNNASKRASHSLAASNPLASSSAKLKQQSLQTIESCLPASSADRTASCMYLVMYRSLLGQEALTRRSDVSAIQ